MSNSNRNLFQLFLEEAKHPFSGWDFSYIIRTGRMRTEPLPWSYASTIIPYIRRANSLLDMGTGGGEFLSQIQPLPPHTCATESFPPNIPLARQRLEPLGIKVFEFSKDNLLPFENTQFDLIINRHESYSTSELFRIIKSGGYFITQQVGEQNDIELNCLFGSTPDQGDTPWTANFAAKELEISGFLILRMAQAFPITRFYDIGALVYYLKAIPWIITDFSIYKYKEILYQLHEHIQKVGYLEVREHRFLIISQKPSL